MVRSLLCCTSEHVHNDIFFVMYVFCDVMYFLIICILQLVQSRINRSFQSFSSIS
jgi:ABC-type amino acid transport system permease subunit